MIVTSWSYEAAIVFYCLRFYCLGFVAWLAGSIVGVSVLSPVVQDILLFSVFDGFLRRVWVYLSVGAVRVCGGTRDFSA